MTTGASVSSVSNFLTHLYGRTSPRAVFSVSVTGGGVQALQWLFCTPGASRSLMDANIPYSRASLDSYLAHGKNAVIPNLPSSVSIEAAASMSAVAYKHATQTLLSDSGSLEALSDCKIFGVSCTAALASTTPKKGPHRCHVAITEESHTRVYSLNLDKGVRSREGEDTVCSRLIIDAISIAAMSHTPSKPSSLSLATEPLAFCQEVLSSSETVEMCTISKNHPAGSDVLDRVTTGLAGHAIFTKKHPPQLLTMTEREIAPHPLVPSVDEYDYYEDLVLPPGTLIFPGSFNPLHVGHVELLLAAMRAHAQQNKLSDSEMAQLPVIFEIAAVNVDKPPLAKDIILSRLHGLLNNPLLRDAGITNYGVSITSEPLFVRKSDLFSRCTFIIGADTMQRLLNPKYYALPSASNEGDGSESAALAAHTMIAALATIAERGCEFIVGGRQQQGATRAQANFEVLGDIMEANKALLPPSIRGMFAGIDESEFRADISSSDIRARG